MLLIQSILFFILGAAVLAFFVLLLAPIIWHRALYLARQAVRMEIPLSLDEVEAEHDFARAVHAVETCRQEEQIAVAKKQAMTARLALNMAQAKICYLIPFEEEARALQQKIIELHEQEQQLNLDNKAKSLKLEKMTGLSQRQKQDQAKIKTQKATIKILKKQISVLKRQISHLEKQELKLKARQQHYHLKLMRAQPDKQDLLYLRQQIQQIAAQIVANNAREGGESSPLLSLIEENTHQNDLARAIHQAITPPLSPASSSAAE